MGLVKTSPQYSYTHTHMYIYIYMVSHLLLHLLQLIRHLPRLHLPGLVQQLQQGEARSAATDKFGLRTINAQG